MNENSEITIPLSKQKIVLLILLGIIFVGLGVWFVISPPPGKNIIFSNPYLIRTAGAFALVFGGLMSVLLIRKLRDTKAGVIINKEGVFDNATAVSAGLIPWKDIKGIEQATIYSETFILIMVHDPQKYIDKVTNVFKRKAIETNCKHYGTPISISTNTIKIKREALYLLLTEQFEKHKVVK